MGAKMLHIAPVRVCVIGKSGSAGKCVQTGREAYALSLLPDHQNVIY